MTTIAYKDGVIAADTRMTISDGDGVPDYCMYGTKFMHTARGVVVAAGDDADIHRFVEWLSKTGKRKKPKKLKSLAALVASQGIVVYYDENLVPMMVDQRHPLALGTGAKAALAAMGMGATAAEAVREAAKWDPYTGGVVEEFKV